ARGWPWCDVNRPALPPRPDFLGDKRQKRREEPQQHRKRAGQRGIRGSGTLRPMFAVPAALHELKVIVAKAPEEGFGPLKNAGVVVRLESLGRLRDERRQ